MPFLSFKGKTYKYCGKKMITHKKRIPLLNLVINCISAISVNQILSLKDEYT